jgi:hypothetical protein
LVFAGWRLAGQRGVVVGLGAVGELRAVEGDLSAPLVGASGSHDITAGHLGGAAVIAVATGRDSAKQLRDAGAGTVLPDLTGTANVVAAVLTVTSGARQP